MGIQGAGRCNGACVADIHRHHAQLVTLQRPLQIQFFIIPFVKGKEKPGYEQLRVLNQSPTSDKTNERDSPHFSISAKGESNFTRET